jgi:hypothetical protein
MIGHSRAVLSAIDPRPEAQPAGHLLATMYRTPCYWEWAVYA